MPSPETIAAWPNCETPDCSRKACASANSVYCFPCSKQRNAFNSAPAGYFDKFRAEVELDVIRDERCEA
jgi:hypothetical protein